MYDNLTMQSIEETLGGEVEFEVKAWNPSSMAAGEIYHHSITSKEEAKRIAMEACSSVLPFAYILASPVGVHTGTFAYKYFQFDIHGPKETSNFRAWVNDVFVGGRD